MRLGFDYHQEVIDVQVLFKFPAFFLAELALVGFRRKFHIPLVIVRWKIKGKDLFR